MAFNLGDIFVTFKAKTEDLQSGVSKVKSLTAEAETAVNRTSFKQFSSSASSAFGGVADAIQGVVTKAAILATTSSVGLGAFVKSAADLQQTSKSFEVLTGNVDVANKLFAQLAKYANTTPFEFPQIAKAGQILLGFGIQSDQVYKRVTMLGDIAAATGADFTSLALVFGQVNATGRLMGQDALQLINNKIPITSILAKDLGISVQEVKARMEDGAISTDQFNASLEKVTQQGGFAFKGTEILAGSLNGRLSTLKDTVLEFGRNLIGVKVDPELGLVVAPGGIFDRFSNLVPKIGQALTDLAPKVQAGFAWVVDHGEEVKNILIAIGVAFVAAKVAAIGFAIAAAANPVTLIAAAIVLLIGVLTYLQLKFDWIGKTLAFIKPYWDQLVAVFNQYLMPSIQALGNTLVNNLWPALMQIWDAVLRLWNALNPGLMTAIQIIAAIIGALWVAQMWLAINVMNVVVGIISLVASVIANLINWIANLASWFGNLVGAGINAVKSIGSWFGSLPGTIGNIVNQIVGWFQGLPGRLTGALSSVGSALSAPFSAGFNAIKSLWNNTVGKINFKVPDWVPGIGGKGWSFPQFATGVENFAGGWAVVGERGPELAYLPKGSNVYSNDKSQGMMGGGVTINGDILINSEADADYFFKKLGRNMDLSGKGLTTRPGSVGV